MDTNKKPLISILIPAYNKPEYTKICLESIFSQEGFEEGEIRVIMIDDASPQNLSQVAKEFQDRYNNFYFERAERNRGMVGNWNYLLSLKKSNYFIFLSNDDFFVNPKVLISLWRASGEGKEDVTYGKYSTLNERGEIGLFLPHERKIPFLKEKNGYIDSIDEQILGHSISFGGILYKDYGFIYDTRAGIWADWEFNLQYLSHKKNVSFYNLPTLVYRIHNEQESVNMNFLNYLKASFYITSLHGSESLINRFFIYLTHFKIACILFGMFIFTKIGLR